MPVATDNAAIMVKDMSIGTDQLGKYLYVVNDSNKVVYTAIETGELVNDSMRIVTKGLDPNQCYVTKALLKVRSGINNKCARYVLTFFYRSANFCYCAGNNNGFSRTSNG